MIERRKYVRAQAAWRVRYRLIDTATGRYLTAMYQGESKNVAAGGLLLGTDEKLQPGSALEFETMLESDKGEVCRRVVASGCVLDTRESGSQDGFAYLSRVQVTGMNPIDRELLSRSVARRITKG
jgi:hypothetical protein